MIRGLNCHVVKHKNGILFMWVLNRIFVSLVDYGLLKVLLFDKPPNWSEKNFIHLYSYFGRFFRLCRLKKAIKRKIIVKISFVDILA